MDDRTYHELVCACCDSPCSVSLNDAGSWEWEVPCPNHGKIVRMPDAVLNDLKAEHAELREVGAGNRVTKAMREARAAATAA